MTTIANDAPEEHEHPKFLAHHFDTPQQQFDSGKLGIWLFLTTEVLLFSGLFCAYSVYRANHPEIFEFAHQYLNKWLGALNTLILIFSSFTMAWGVRAAQVGKQKLCVILLAITFVCGAGFLVVKGIEYYSKWVEVLLIGPAYNPKEMPTPVIRDEAADKRIAAEAGQIARDEGVAPVAATPTPVTFTDAAPVATAPAGYAYEESKIARASSGPAGMNGDWLLQENARLTHEKSPGIPVIAKAEPPNAHIFFAIYFLMTGLHGLHVIAGMSLIAWVFFRARRGDFSPEYFSPVDFVGLYWHIVDIVWIFLFPLLYLIN